MISRVYVQKGSPDITVRYRQVFLMLPLLSPKYELSPNCLVSDEGHCCSPVSSAAPTLSTFWYVVEKHLREITP